MLHELRRILDKDESLVVGDLRRASSIILERQFLFGDKKRDQKPYNCILDNEDYYRNLFDALDLDMICDRTAGYAGVVPRERSLALILDTEHSMFLLVLRLIYERCVQECRIGEYSQAFTDSESILELYESHTKRVRPGLVRLREILKTFSRQGLLEIDEDEDKVIRFRIRPSVRDMVTHGFLNALEDYASLGTSAADEVVEEEGTDENAE